MESESVLMMRGRASYLRQQIAEMRATITPLEFELQQVDAAITLMTNIPAKGAEASRSAAAHFARKASPDAAKLTIKQLVVKALTEHLPNGGTSLQLLEVFAREWGRNEIMRTSLSPQLSRLKDDGKIELHGKVWKVAPTPEFRWDDFSPIKENEPRSGDAGGSDADRDDGRNVISGPDQPIPVAGSTS